MSLSLLVVALKMQCAQAQIVVYTNDFTGPDGFPPAGFALLSGNTDFSPGSNASVQMGGVVGSVALTSNELSTWVSVEPIVGITNKGYALASSPISAYIAPFNPILTSNTYIIGWNFNIRTSLPATGFGTGFDNAAVILACTDPNTRSAGNGYAVTFDPTSPTDLQIIRYTGGLTGTITPIVTSTVSLGAGTDYASVGVRYDPDLDKWSLFVRDDGSAGFADPGTGILSLGGEAVDATYTSATMTSFGFYGNYSVAYTGLGPDVENGYYDSYEVTLYCGSITGESIICIGSTTGLTHPLAGGTWSSSNTAIATVDASGLVTGISAGDVDITYTIGTCTLVLSMTVLSTIGPAPITGTASICIGGTTTLSAVPPPVGTWSSSAAATASVDAAGVVTGIVAGTAIISYAIPSGCNSRLTVTVNPDPTAITGTLSVCEGATQTLSSTPAGGTWSSGTASVATINASTGVVSGLTTGTSTIIYTSAAGCTTSAVVTVNTAPTAITASGSLTVCVGNTLALGSTPAGGVWSAAATGAVSIDAAGVVTGLVAGTNVVSYTAIGCYRTGIVTVNPAVAAITGSATTCIGRNTPLANSVSGGTWSSSTPAVGTISTVGQVTGLTAGTTTITYTVSAGCAATLVVTVNTPPGAITGNAAVCLGATSALASAPLAGTWSSSNTPVATISAAGVVGGVATGTSVISYITPDGCNATRIVTVNPLPGAITGTAVVCVLENITPAATPAGGTWSSSNITIGTVNTGSGTVTGIAGGTFTLTYTRLGCNSTRTITVNALPSTFTPAGPTTVCVGLTTTLNSTPTPGTWSSSNTTVASVVTGTGVVTGNVAGTALISYTANVTGCVRTRTITVNALPAAIGGTTSICPGSSATLTNTSTPGTWSSSDPGIATINTGTGVLGGVVAGTSTVTYTQNTGCIRTTVVSVSAAPPAIITPIGDTNLCPGGFVTLTSSTSPGVTYEWFNSGVLIPGAATPTYIANASGAYQVRVNVAVGCSSLSIPVIVSVNPATATITVPGGTTSTCSGTPIILNANPGAGLTYQWELGGSPIALATAATYNAALGGIYTVRVTNAFGCWAVSAPESIVVNPTPSNVVTASGPLTFCNGSSVTLSAVAGYTYQWYNSLGAIAGAVGATYTATTPEDYYVEVTGTGACTGTSAISTVVVNPLPDVSITPGGTRVFCAGGNVLLDAAPGYGYQWYRNGIAITGANAQSYLAFAAGGYRVEVTDLGTGCTDMTHADTVVTVISSPTSLPLTPSKFCWGGSSLLSTSVSGLGSALSYQWFFNGVAIPGAVGSSYSAGVSGNYHCRISVPGSCTITTNTVPVTEVPLPDPPITFNGTIFQTGNYYVAYQWYKNLVLIPGATSNTTPATSDGNYKVAVTDTNGCQSVSSVYVLTGWKGGSPTTGVTSVNSTDISIFPNPAKLTVNVVCTAQIRTVISGIDGRSLIDVQNEHTIDISNLADGMYIITVYGADNALLKTQKLIKQAE